MEEELLKELNRLLRPAIDTAWWSANRNHLGADPRTRFLDDFKIQIDHNKVDLSNTMYQLDLAMQGCGTDVERAAAEFTNIFPPEVQELPEVDEGDYVKSAKDGFEVWNGTGWVQLSKRADIKVEIYENPENDNRPAVRVRAQDGQTGAGVRYVDNDIVSPGWDLACSWSGLDDDSATLRQGSHYWEDPFYKMAKNGSGLDGMTAGALEMRHIGNLTPWRTGSAFRNSDGWYRNAEGIIENLNKQRGIGAGGYQRSAQRALGKAKIFKGAGKVFFAVGAGLSFYQISDSISNNYSNKSKVITKASIDIAIAAIGVYGGPIGWLISGSYFILDVSGAFGSWGQPSGLSQSLYEQSLLSNLQSGYGNHIQSLQFEVDYASPIEQVQREMYLEERSVPRDNTSVALPKLIFKKD